MIIYLNGKILPIHEARIPPDDRGLLLGDGLFETIAVHAGIPFQFSAHYDRLANGAGNLKVPLDHSAESLLEKVRELLERNELGSANAVVRITLTRGPGPRGLTPPPDPSPTLMITTAAWTPKTGDPVTLRVVSLRVNESSPLCGIKSSNRLEAILAKQEALDHGAQDALLLNSKEHLAEASAANIFLVQAGRLVTPPGQDGALPGVTRKLVLEMAAAGGIEASEESLSLDDLRQADEVFLTNSLVGIQPVSRVDEEDWDAPGPLTRKLQGWYEQAIRG